ncbi:unnamed protein product [Paramecium sonneborni]|uniref:ATP-dependent RNA helicase n=1 Tax=Paramecium sonneborni TaxID=65129 RepID=A0A8S1R4F8_9CILI|nr:unnamed protein product [Paramecium sonneborni]
MLIQSKKCHPQNLPIRAYKEQILYGIDTNSTLIILAETGSGKTTQIPQYLIEAGYGGEERVLVSLPRKMAAISIAQRVSDENGTELGQDIGYRVRFESKVSENTKIEYVTDGTLIQIIMGNPLIEGYSIVMLDDIHERTLNTDLLLCLIKKIQKKRPQLKIIVSSATMEVQLLSNFFTNSKIIAIRGRNYEVDIMYLLEPCKNYVIAAVELAYHIHKKMPEGDILVFLTSVEEILAFIHLWSHHKTNCIVLPLHANLGIDKQLLVFKQHSNRKIVVSTNVAESSVTIDGIVYVIDSCYQKVKVYDYKRNLDQLNVLPISQQSAAQRAGRAGRTKDGICYRLCTKEDYLKLPITFPPEILRSNLTELILQIRSFSLTPNHLQCSNTFLTPVSNEQLIHSINTLMSLKLIDENFSLTELGNAIVDYPLETQLAVCVENSFLDEYQCSDEMLKIASILSIQGGIFSSDATPLQMLKAKKALGCKEGDVLSLHNIFVRYMNIGNKGNWCDTYRVSKHKLESAGKIYKQIQKRRKNRQIKSSIQDVEAVQRCFVSGFFSQVAQRENTAREGVYRNIYTKQLVHLHPASVLTVSYPEWVIYHELIEQNHKLTMHNVTELDPHWLFEIAPHFYKDARQEIAELKHQQEKEKLDKVDADKQQKQQELLMIQESKVIFGSIKSKKPGFKGFGQTQFPLKSKEQRLGSLSFNDDEDL